MSTTGIDGRWARAGDLGQIKGIGVEYRAILQDVGVASIDELGHRNALNLKAMIEIVHGPGIGLTEPQIQTWIDTARATKESQPA